jgi:NAD(P)-dependent dehydrogenase (short-subunit alcohol dehydrogenase family)
VNAFVLVDHDGALAAAKLSEARWHSGEPLGPGDGVPTSVKDARRNRRPHRAAPRCRAMCGWSELMAVDLHGTGVSVKLIEPGPVDTQIWDQPDNDDPIHTGPKFSPEEAAVGIIAVLDSDGFEHDVPDMKAVVDLENADIDTYVAAAAGMARQ